MPTVELSFPPVVDSTMLVAFRGCEKKAAYEFVHNLAGPKSTDLHFGGAFAKGMEVARKSFFIAGRGADEAVCDGINAAWTYYGRFDDQRSDYDLDKKAKSEANLLLALEGYFREWPLGGCGLIPLDGDKGIEFTFAIPIPGTRSPSGYPIVYGGRFDLLGTWSGLPTVADEKTTGSFGPGWAEQWGLRNQFLGYVWSARQYGVPVQQVLIRGIAIQKTQIQFLQAPAFYSDYLIDRWYAQLVIDLNRFADAFRAGRFNYNFGDTCTSYGGCSFRELCKARVPEEWFGNFTRRDWDPLAKNPEKKEAA